MHTSNHCPTGLAVALAQRGVDMTLEVGLVNAAVKAQPFTGGCARE